MYLHVKLAIYFGRNHEMNVSTHQVETNEQMKSLHKTLYDAPTIKATQDVRNFIENDEENKSENQMQFRLCMKSWQQSCSSEKRNYEICLPFY